MLRSVCDDRGVLQPGARLVLAILLAVGCFAALSCGSLGSPTEPEPESSSPAPAINPGATPFPQAVLGPTGPPATPTPSPSPGEPSPEPTATPDSSGCGDPLPPPLSRINVNVHLRGAEAWTLDSTPQVGPDLAYCQRIGFTDGRSFCPVRPEGHPQRLACELYATGRAKDTDRAGPTWYFNGNFCTGRSSGCQNHPENQYQLLVYVGGTFRACAASGVCGEVVADR